MTAVELVLFFGPPFVGKTLHYYRHYSKTHSRISAREIFEKEKNANLRFVILKAIRLLCQGKSVVIDDENWYKETRKSYSSLVKQRFVPNISFGYQQCLWTREWALAYWTLLRGVQGRSPNMSGSKEKLDCWFSRKRTTLSNLHPPEFPTVNEGFSLVTVKPAIVCNTPYKFSLPGLFVQWESIIADSHGGSSTYKQGTPAVINKWLSKNPSGRLIIVGLKPKHDEDSLDERTKLILGQLASQVCSPIYFTFIDEKRQPDQFSKLPHPGFIAFLQRLHTIHLYHKSTMYVYESEEHYKAANTVGIRAIKGVKLLANSDMVNAVYCGEIKQTLPFLKDIQQLNCQSRTGLGNAKAGEVSTEARIPFLSRARESSLFLVWEYGDGKINGLCFKDKLILERYQTQYALAAQPVLPLGKVSPEADKTEIMASTLSANTSSQSTSSADLNIEGFGLKNVNLREIAETPGRYNGGFLCKKKIFNLDVELLDCRLKISSKCMGSTGKAYDVEAIVSDSCGLVEARCSCPDPVGRNGRCKHVIGLLLRYQDHSAPSSSQMLEARRCLPSWMSSVNTEGSEHRKDSSLKVTPKTVHKKVTRTGGANILYSMSEEELVETAKEVLKKHEELFTLDSEKPSTQEAGKSFSKEFTPEKERTVAKREYKSDVLEELIFGGRSDESSSCKRICSKSFPSFAEETPTDKMPSTKDNDSAISPVIPDSLVPETVSVIFETVESDEESSSRNEGASGVEENETSFQDFLDELIQ